MRNVFLVLVLLSLVWLPACQNRMLMPEAVLPAPAAVIPVSQQIEVQENHCVSCHTDMDQLISTAKPEEEVEAESSGAG